jgi:hypothetical protein
MDSALYGACLHAQASDAAAQSAGPGACVAADSQQQVQQPLCRQYEYQEVLQDDSSKQLWLAKHSGAFAMVWLLALAA